MHDESKVDDDIWIYYLDFQRVIDKFHVKDYQQKVSHILYLKWLEKWLTGWKQMAMINDQTLEWLDVTVGVQQGSVLEPILCSDLIM